MTLIRLRRPEQGLSLAQFFEQGPPENLRSSAISPIQMSQEVSSVALIFLARKISESQYNVMLSNKNLGICAILKARQPITYLEYLSHMQFIALVWLTYYQKEICFFGIVHEELDLSF